MRIFLATIGIILLTSCQNSTSPSRLKTIMIRSVGEIEALPDMATFQISLYCMDKSVQTSKKCLVDKSNDLTGRLQSFGINKNDILTTSVDMNKSYTWQNNTQIFQGYRSSTTVIVTVRDIERLDEIYTELLENRNLDIGGLNFSHTKLDSLENEAYAKALEKSGILADKLLNKIPESDKEILKIGNVEISASMPTAEEMSADAAYETVAAVQNQKSVAISNGTIKIAATLFVEYKID
ncbi:MAG TPA: SIMPL domain-containing protein [Flavobacterium sp.]